MAKEDNLYILHVDFDGPKGTPFEGGKFRLLADLSDNYPFKAPKCKFITRIYHPNINKETGELCENLYKKDWKPVKNLGFVFGII